MCCSVKWEKEKVFMTALTEAIKKALDQAIDKNYLDGYFEREREEIFMTTLLYRR